MAERTVVYDDDLLHTPQADIAGDAAPQSSGAAGRRSQHLRRHLSALNCDRAHGFAHESTYGNTPSVVYQQQSDGSHGNFHPASYRRILADPAWSSRLQKSYTASRRIAHSESRQRGELDCANSSDALLMNIFCHPTALRSSALQALLGIASPRPPDFGVRSQLHLRRQHVDRTEFDMAVHHTHGLLLVEAKLSETDFQTARPALMERYETFAEVFDIGELPRRNDRLCSYQLLRSILAAHHLQASFTVMLDGRRTDLLEDVFLIYRSVRSASLRNQLHVITWQEIAACVPRTLQTFLADKYGILATR